MIQIGNIKSIYTENLNIVPDDRQELVKVVSSQGVGGVVVEDYGVVDNGEVITLSAVFSSSDYAALSNIWKNRTLSAVTLDDGTVISSARIVIRSTSYYDTKLSGYKKVTMEVWRV